MRGSPARIFSSLAALACATQANAGPVNLAPPTVSILPAQSFTVITTPGVYHFVPPGTNAPTDATALFGAEPIVSLAFSSNNGDAEAMLTYQIELVPPVPPVTPPGPGDPGVAVPITITDTVTAPGLADPFDGTADALINISYNAYQPLNMENCAGNVFTGCPYGGPFTTTPLSSVNSVDLVPGIAYTVQLRADIAQSGFATVSAGFAAPAGYSLAFSPGVSAVPEPASWLMMLAGLCSAGVAMCLQRRQVALSA